MTVYIEIGRFSEVKQRHLKKEQISQTISIKHYRKSRFPSHLKPEIREKPLDLETFVPTSVQ